MTEYLIPAQNGASELVEKRSRFLGRVFQADSEEQARAYLEQVKKEHHDARHNCWCYRIRESGVERYSDDGEPQGTAGQPILNVFQREEVTNVCCVVTRYFGGVLLGAGGLVRAYSAAAKMALDTAGIAVVRRWIEVSVNCPYALFERVKLEVSSAGGALSDTEYGADVTLKILLPAETQEIFADRIRELTAGTCFPEPVGEVFRAAPRQDLLSGQNH